LYNYFSYGEAWHFWFLIAYSAMRRAAVAVGMSPRVFVVDGLVVLDPTQAWRLLACRHQDAVAMF
jgi:hypothetical protein